MRIWEEYGKAGGYFIKMYKIIGFSGVEETSMELCVPDMGVFFVNPDQNYPGRGILLKRAFHPPGGLASVFTM